MTTGTRDVPFQKKPRCANNALVFAGSNSNFLKSLSTHASTTICASESLGAMEKSATWSVFALSLKIPLGMVGPSMSSRSGSHRPCVTFYSSCGTSCPQAGKDRTVKQGYVSIVRACEIRTHGTNQCPPEAKSRDGT